MRSAKTGSATIGAPKVYFLRTVFEAVPVAHGALRILLALGSLVLLAGTLDLSPSHVWTPISPVLFTTLAGWILCHLIRHQIRRKTTLHANVS